MLNLEPYCCAEQTGAPFHSPPFDKSAAQRWLAVGRRGGSTQISEQLTVELVQNSDEEQWPSCRTL